MVKIRIIIFFLILFNLVVLSGCWDMQEINELGLVTAVGIDKADGENRYSITVQIANPVTDNSSDNKGESKSTVWTGTADGNSLFDATRNLTKISSRKIMWAHNNLVVIGESLAKEGITPVVDYFTHNPELRLRAAVVVSKGDAKDYIAEKIGMESPSGVSFIKLEGFREIVGESASSHMLQVSAALKSEYGNPLISRIDLKKALMQSEESEDKEKSSNTVELAGAAVFKKDKMLGWLSPEESRGISWILNQTRNTAVTVSDTEHQDKSVSVEIESVKAKIIAEVSNGMPGISINISGKGDIVEEDGSTSREIDEVKEHVGELVGKRIEEEVKKSLEAMQKKYMVDCLGFAAIVHAQNKREWNDGLKDKWEKIFPQIPVNVSADITIETSTLNQEPMKIY